MQPADVWNHDHLATVLWLRLACNRRVVIQRQGRACVMVVVEVSSKDSQQVPFIENNEMTKALASNRSDDSLDVRRLPGRTVRNHHLLGAHVCDSASEELTVDRVTIADQLARRFVVRERFDDLLSRPFCARVSRYVEMNNHATVMAENNEGEQDAKRCGRNGEEVDGGDITNMIVEESMPGL